MLFRSKTASDEVTTINVVFDLLIRMDETASIDDVVYELDYGISHDPDIIPRLDFTTEIVAGTSKITTG